MSLLSAPEILKFPRKNLDVLFIALLIPYLAACIGRVATEEVVLQLVRSKCIPILLYGLEACPLRKADLNVLDFVVNRFIVKLFCTNNIGMVKECQSYFSFQLPSEMLKQRTERFDMKFKSLLASWL